MTASAPSPAIERTLLVPEGGEGNLFVFALDPPSPTKLSPKGVGVLPMLLGYPDLDPDFGEIVSARRLGGMPLPRYIEQTYGVPVDEVQSAALREATGRLAIVRRRAFGEGARQLTLAPGIWYLMTLQAPPRPAPIPTVTEMDEPPAPSGPSPLIPILGGILAFLVTLALVLWLVL